MNFLISGVFWGAMLVLLGTSMIIKTVFKIDIPIFRLIFALIIIYWGVKLLFGTSLKKSDENNVIFDNARITQVEDGGEYNVIFGKSVIDLSDIELTEKSSEVEINIIFGSGEIYLNPEIPVKILSSAVFAEGKLPKGSVNFFGDHVYKSPTYEEGEKFLKIELNTIFGSSIVRKR